MTEEQSTFGSESGDEFAQIDLVSNHTVFQDKERYRALLRGEDLPVHTFSSFIHEATHHWCFISPVGTALSLLYLSVAKKALRWTITGNESQLKEALDDLCVFNVAVSWLRPLSEGLAQFAEYDVLPPASGPLISPPLLATLTHLFNLPRRLARAPRGDAVHAFHELADDISKWRLSRQTIERKSELLLQPIGAEGSAYLLGYLTVKQLWQSSSRFYNELKDADVFLMFLRKLVFGDYALVAEILDRTRPAFRRGLGLGQRLFERLHAIRLMSFDDEVPWSKWEKLLTTPSAGDRADGFDVADPITFAALDTKRQVRKGMALQARYIREVAEAFDVQSGQFPVPFPADYFVNVIRERHLMWLGDLSATWVSTGRQAGRILVDGDVVFDDFKLQHTSDEGLNELTLDIYIDLYEGYQLTTVGNERGVFGFAASQKASDRAQSELATAKLDRRETTRVTNLIHEVMRAYVRGTNWQESLEKLWTSGGRDLLDKTYLGFACNFNEAVQSVIAQRGLADVLQNDADLVRNVAAISLAASAGMSPERLVELCPDPPLNPLDAIRTVNGLWAFSDFPLASVGDDGFLNSAF